MSIARIWREWVRSWVFGRRREIVFALIVFFAASVSFCLGYLANRELNHAPIVIEIRHPSAP